MVSRQNFEGDVFFKASSSGMEISLDEDADGLLDENDLAGVMSDIKAAPTLRDAVECVDNPSLVFPVLDIA